MKRILCTISILFLQLIICRNTFAQKLQIPVDVDIIQKKLNANFPFIIYDWEVEEFEKNYSAAVEVPSAYKMDEKFDQLKEELNLKYHTEQIGDYSSPQTMILPLFINKNGHLGTFDYIFYRNYFDKKIMEEVIKTSGDWIGKVISGRNQASFIKLKFYYGGIKRYGIQGEKTIIRIDSIKLVDQDRRLKTEFEEFNLYNPVIFKEDLDNDLSFLNKKGEIIHKDSLGRELYRLTSQTEYPEYDDLYSTSYYLKVQFNENGSKELLNINGYDFKENYPKKAYRHVFISQFESFLPRFKNPSYQGKLIPYQYNFFINPHINQSGKTLSVSTFLPSSLLNSRLQAKNSSDFKIISSTTYIGNDSATFNSIEREGYQISYKNGYNQLTRDLNKLLENQEINLESPSKDSLNIRFVVHYGLFGYISNDKVVNSNHQLIRNTLKKLGNNWIPANVSGFGEKGYQSIGEIVCKYQLVKNHEGKSRIVVSHIKPVWTKQYKIQKVVKK